MVDFEGMWANFTRDQIWQAFLTFLTEIIICSFNNNALEKWAQNFAMGSFVKHIVVERAVDYKHQAPSYLQHNLCLVVIGRLFACCIDAVSR